MTRIKRGSVARKRRKKILNMAKGFRGSSSNLFRPAMQRVMKALLFGYAHRRLKKRIFRKLWIVRVNIAVRSFNSNLTYNQFIFALKTSNCQLNRKWLSQLSVREPAVFKKNFLDKATEILSDTENNGKASGSNFVNVEINSLSTNVEINSHFSNSNGSEPSSNGSEPSSNGSEPSSNGSEPSSNGSEPSSNGSEPSSNGSEPSSNGSEPSSNGSEPSSNGSEPSSNGSEPSSNGSEPSSNGSEPSSNGTGPSSNSSGPSSNDSGPSSNGTGPSSNGSGSSSNGSTPN